MNNTQDLSCFGKRELEEAGKLLLAYANTPLYIGEGLKLEFNMTFGCVFLVNEDHQVFMLNEDNRLEEFLSCPICGAEGFADEIGWDNDAGACGACIEE